MNGPKEASRISESELRLTMHKFVHVMYKKGTVLAAFPGADLLRNMVIVTRRVLFAVHSCTLQHDTRLRLI